MSSFVGGTSDIGKAGSCWNSRAGLSILPAQQHSSSHTIRSTGTVSIIIPAVQSKRVITRCHCLLPSVDVVHCSYRMFYQQYFAVLMVVSHVHIRYYFRWSSEVSGKLMENVCEVLCFKSPPNSVDDAKYQRHFILCILLWMFFMCAPLSTVFQVMCCYLSGCMFLSSNVCVIFTGVV